VSCGKVIAAIAVPRVKRS